MQQQGTCQCNKICYQLNAEPLTCYACHCSDCQSSSGSAFSMSMIVNSKDLTIISGEPAVNKTEQNGIQVQRHYCAECGTILWYSADVYAGLAALKPGTFTDTSWFKPVAHVWTGSAQTWFQLPADAMSYEKQPELSELIDLWQKKKLI